MFYAVYVFAIIYISSFYLWNLEARESINFKEYSSDNSNKSGWYSYKIIAYIFNKYSDQLIASKAFTDIICCCYYKCISTEWGTSHFYGIIKHTLFKHPQFR